MALDIQFEHFYLYDELVGFLREVQEKCAELARVESLVKTPEGRDVWLVTVTDWSTGPADGKAAYYVQAGLHAQEAAGTTAALHFLRTLLCEDTARALLADTAFYIVPRVNPDGTEYALTTRAPIRSRQEVVERRNGLIPKDMNGDGRILSMRWEDPAGGFREDDVDPRLLVPREPGDVGPFYSVVAEGEIPDYDGTGIVAGTRTIDMNRNYAVNWKAISVSSDYPFSEPEVRALGEFTLSHRNIFAGIDFHCGTNAILRLTTDSDGDLNQSDLELTLRLGTLAERVTGLPLMSTRDYGDAWRKKTILPGNSNHWAYHRLGISHYVIELGNGFNSAGITAEEYFRADARTRAVDFMRRILKCHDEHGSEIFVPWQAFEHPQLGSVEIGGLLQGNAYYMVPSCMADVIPHTTEFLFRHAAYRPRLMLTDVESESCGGDVYRVRATLANVGGFSTYVMMGGGTDRRDVCELGLSVPDEGEVLSRSAVIQIGALEPNGGKGYGEWFVRAGSGTAVTVRGRHPRAGSVEQQLLL